MIGKRVGHMRDKIETEGMIEALVTVDQGKVQGQPQIGIELDVSSVGSSTILQETTQASREVEQIQQITYKVTIFVCIHIE